MLQLLNPGLSFRHAILAAAALLLLVGLAFAPTTSAQFNIDDEQLITDNPAMQSGEGLLRIWTTTDQWDYWPLTYTAYWLQFQIFGANPLPYHLLNLLLHAANAWLLYLLLRRLAVPAAWLAAAIFTVHPIMVESAAWIAELKNLLSAFFMLLAAHAYLRFDEEGSSRAYAASIALFALALLAKASTVMLPPALWLLLWWRRGEWRWEDGKRLLPHFALALVAGLVTMWFASHRGGDSVGTMDANLIERFSIAGKSFWFYLRQFVYPQPCFQYPRWTEQPGLVDYLPFVAATALFVLLWIGRKSWGRPGILGLGIYTLMLAPVLGFVGAVFFRISFVADHFAYLPMLGLAPLAACGLEKALTKLRFPKLFPATGSFLVAAYGAATWQSSYRFETRESLHRMTLEQNPESWHSHLGLGMLAIEKGDQETAERHFLEAVRINPRDLRSLNNLANIRHKQKRDEEAEAYMQTVLREQPQNPMAHLNLGNLRMEQGKVGEAVGHYRAAVASLPIWAGAHFQLGKALARMERWKDAEESLREALRLNPKNAIWHCILGDVLQAQEKHTQALPSYQNAVDRDPQLAEAWIGLAKSFVALGRKGEGLLPATRASMAAHERGDRELEEKIQAWIRETF